MSVGPLQWSAQLKEEVTVAKVTGGDVALKLMQEVAELRQDFTAMQEDLTAMKDNLTAMRENLARTQENLGALVSHVGRADKHMARMAHLLGVLAENTGARLNDHERLIEVLEAKQS